MNVFVTGANGFVGAWLCKKLIENGHAVTGLARKTSDLSLLEGIHIKRVYGCLENPDTWSHALQNTDVLYHCAARVNDWGKKELFWQANVEGTKNILDEAVKHQIRRFVYVSTIAVHTYTGAKNMNESSPQLRSSFEYANSKRAAEAIVNKAHQQGLIESVIVRPGDVVGPGDRTMLLKMKDMIRKGRLALINRGRAVGAFTYVENLADGLILAGSSPEAAGETFVITDGIEKSWYDYFFDLTCALNRPPPRYTIPGSMAWLAAVILENMYRLFFPDKRPPVTHYIVRHLTKDVHFSIKKAESILGFYPAVDWSESIHRTAKWFMKNN